jgi:hypothetical protein
MSMANDFGRSGAVMIREWKSVGAAQRFIQFATVRNKMMVDPQWVWGKYLAVVSGENQKGGKYEPDSPDIGKTQWVTGRMEGNSR